MARTRELIKRVDEMLDDLGVQLDRADARLAETEAVLANWQPQNEEEEFEKRYLTFEHEQQRLEHHRYRHKYEYERTLRAL